MADCLSLLRKSGLFSDLSEEVLQQHILPHSVLSDYAKGQFLIEPRQLVNGLAVVLSGKVQIMHLFYDGSYSLMSSLTAGHILGADLVCTRSRLSPYHAVAATPTRILQFPAELLTTPGMLPESQRLLILDRLLTLISHENMRKEYRLAILSQKGLRERIITYLTMQSARLQQTTFSIPFSREELAAFLCVNRSALSHELSRMQQERLISFRKNTFTILNLPQGDNHTMA